MPTQLVPTCTDSDGGLNYYALGNATGAGYTGEVNTINDGCIIGGPNDGWLREALCKDNVTTWSDYNCSAGCKNGVCIDVTPACIDSDSGKDYYSKEMSLMVAKCSKMYAEDFFGGQT